MMESCIDFELERRIKKTGKVLKSFPVRKWSKKSCENSKKVHFSIKTSPARSNNYRVLFYWSPKSIDDGKIPPKVKVRVKTSHIAVPLSLFSGAFAILNTVGGWDQ